MFVVLLIAKEVSTTSTVPDQSPPLVVPVTENVITAAGDAVGTAATQTPIKIAIANAKNRFFWQMDPRVGIKVRRMLWFIRPLLLFKHSTDVKLENWHSTPRPPKFKGVPSAPKLSHRDSAAACGGCLSPPNWLSVPRN
jgi:hypothetical protein